MESAGVVLLISLFAGVIGFLIWLQFHLAAKRREAFLLTATKLGLTYARDDPFNTVDLPFDLFNRGDGRGVENVMHGTAAGMPVRMFDYWYYEQSTDSKGNTSRSYHRFSCAMAWFDADCPHLALGREGFFSRLADKLGFRDIEFESEEFNRAWQVKSEDRRFASAFVDARMMEWLLAEGAICSYEVVGPILMCSMGRLKPEEFENLLEVLRRFHAHIPDVVASLYPRTRSAEA